MFPIIMNDGKTPFPEDEPIFYIISKNGIYLYKDLNTIRSLTRVDSISFLKEVKGFAELKIPIIPKEIIAMAVGYLRYVYHSCHSEAGLVLHLVTKEEKYELHCPTQEVSSGSVDWNNKKEPIPQGSIRVCSIHSHGSGQAFHSIIDKKDEKNFDGIHITIGHIDEDTPTIVVSLVVNGNRFKLNEKEILEYVEIDVYPGNCCDKIKQSKQSDTTIYEDYQSTLGNHNSRDITSPPKHKLKKWNGYVISNIYDSDERRFGLDVKLNDYNFPDDWKNKFKYKIPKIYQWDTKLHKLVEVECKDNYYGSGYYGKEYDWGNYNYDDDVPSYPITTYNPHYSKAKNDPNDYNEYIPPKDEFNDQDIDLHPVRGNCHTCIYREIAREAIDQGFLEDYGLDDYIGSMDPVGMDDIPDDKHLETKDYIREFDLGYDEKGNMIDSEGNCVIIMSKEEEEKQDHINAILLDN